MTKIVRASLGLPTLQAGPQFQNSKPVLVIWYWNLRFVCNLVLVFWDFINSCIKERLLKSPLGAAKSSSPHSLLSFGDLFYQSQDALFWFEAELLKWDMSC